jgi:hypothetical protein
VLRALWLALGTASLILPTQLTPAGTPAVRQLRVLFIGNSLTSVNDVPRLVEQLTADTQTPVRATAIVRNDFSLEDHWAARDAVRAIETGGWSFVVLQQGPSALPESRVQLRASARKFDEIVRRAGARSALYMVWPSSARRSDFDNVRDSYSAAAADVNGLFIPAGDAWREAWRRQPDLSLYGDDGFHPTPQASYLAALVIAHVLTGHDATSMPVSITGWPADWLPPGRARLLQGAARQAVRAMQEAGPHEKRPGRFHLEPPGP